MSADDKALRRIQDIRAHVYRIQDKASSVTRVDLFEDLAELVTLCDQAIDLEIHRPAHCAGCLGLKCEGIL